MLSFTVQAIIVLVVAGFVKAEVVEGRLLKLTDEIDWKQCLPIVFLSFQSAGQIVASRALRINEIPTVVLTSMLHDLATDPALLVSYRKNAKRNQMLGAFVATVTGAVIGGFVSIKTGQMQNTLWLVAVLKFIITGAWALWPAEEVDATD